MKKHKVKKLVAKIIGEELAKYDSRIYDLEVKTGIKAFEIRRDTFSHAITGDIAVKDAEHISDGSKTELTEFEVGEWYKSLNHQHIMVFFSTDENDNYGFNIDGIFSNRFAPPKNILAWRLATKEEVEQAIRNEAVRKGFKKGATIKWQGRTRKIIDEMYWATGTDCLAAQTDSKDCLNEYFPIMLNGVWAEIIEEPKQEDIDWSVPGQLVCNGDHCIAITSGSFNSKNSTFKGTIIRSSCVGEKQGFIFNDFMMSLFKPFKGEITLKNDN